MECEQCGCVAENHAIHKVGHCPFCDSAYPAIEYAIVTVLPTQERALVLRDLCTDVMTMLLSLQLGHRYPEFRDAELSIWNHCKEQSEYYDELANGARD